MPSFVGESFEFDIFVSYAHGHNPSDLGVNRRNHVLEWSRTMVEDLKQQINLLLSDSGRQIAIWMDPKVRATSSLEGNLDGAVERSALLLVLMSGYYLRSEWCKREAERFAFCATRQGNVDPASRKFVINILPTEGERWPSALRDKDSRPLLGFPFCKELSPDNWSPYGFPDPQAVRDDAYWTGIKRLAGEITSQLRRFKFSQQQTGPIPIGVGRKVLIGYMHDTLLPLRKELRKAFADLSIQVLPDEKQDISDPTTLEAIFQQHLQQADAVVLACNEYCGTWPANEPGGFIGLQIRKARDLGKRCYALITVKERDKVQTEEYANLLDRLSDELSKTKGRAILDSMTSTKYAAFVRDDLDHMDPASVARPAIICSNLPSDEDDYMQFHELVLDAVGETNRYAIIPSYEAKSGQIRLTKLAEKIESSDTILVICFDQDWDWAQQVLLQLKQLSTIEKAKRTKLLVVGPRFDPNRGTVDMRAFRFTTFNRLDLDKNSFKEALKFAIVPAVNGSAAVSAAN
jgi:hypothetical protein